MHIGLAFSLAPALTRLQDYLNTSMLSWNRSATTASAVLDYFVKPLQSTIQDTLNQMEFIQFYLDGTTDTRLRHVGLVFATGVAKDGTLLETFVGGGALPTSTIQV